MATLTTSPDPNASEMPADVRFLNRDLSWLEFNRRVLAQAEDPSLPLLDRVRFLAIFSSNLDEFYMKRVGLLQRLADEGLANFSPDGMTPRQVLFVVRTMVSELLARQADCYEREIRPRLASAGIHLMSYGQLSEDQRHALDRWHKANLFPVLTPLAVDPGHRFPFISNLSENLGILMSAPGQAEPVFARVKIPDVVPRYIPVPPASNAPSDPPGTVRFVSIDEFIRNNLDDLFPGMTIHAADLFRITRNAAIEQDDDAENLRESVEAELRLRRFAEAVRLELQPGTPASIRDFLVRELGLEPQDVYERPGPMEYGDLFQIADLDRPDLKVPRWRPVVPPRIADEDANIFAIIRERDLLLHHPYESFTASVERFIAAAAADPDVLAIKQTIYRSSRESPFVESLVRAAEEGKHVACLVELRARFDEQKNLRFARKLEKAGVHVAYGVVGLKTHCKTSLVVRREPDGLRCYAHLGTGNYNPKTAQLYTDISLLTADPALCDDVVNLFNYLTGRSHSPQYQRLLVAPQSMRESFARLIDREINVARAGGKGRIIAKMNSLEDRLTSERLYEASNAGVEITLFVRGFCCVRPGVPGLSSNIRVVSVIGRFLEHSRIYHFGAGKPDPLDGDWYISSADWMYRNLSNRVESAAPVFDRAARQRLARILQVLDADQANAWDLGPDGAYTRRSPRHAAPDSLEALGTFEVLMRDAQASTLKA